MGTVSDFLFDDTTWKLRWLLVQTGSPACEPTGLLDEADERMLETYHGWPTRFLPPSQTKTQAAAAVPVASMKVTS